MNAATATTDELVNAITAQLIEQECTQREVNGYRYELDEPTADYDSSEDGSASWWWTGEVRENGETIATFSIPDWYVDAASVEITWA